MADLYKMLSSVEIAQLPLQSEAVPRILEILTASGFSEGATFTFEEVINLIKQLPESDSQRRVAFERAEEDEYLPGEPLYGKLSYSELRAKAK